MEKNRWNIISGSNSMAEKFNNPCSFCDERVETEPVACGYCREMTTNKTRHWLCDKCWKRCIKEGHPEFIPGEKISFKTVHDM